MPASSPAWARASPGELHREPEQQHRHGQDGGVQQPASGDGHLGDVVAEQPALVLLLVELQQALLLLHLRRGGGGRGGARRGGRLSHLHDLVFELDHLGPCRRRPGPGRRRLRRLCRALGVTDRVRFLGAVPDGALPSLYAGAAAVCVPSRYEGFGLCAAEGLAAGVPVLVSDRGALPDLAGGSATVLPASDVAAWSAAMARAATAPPARAAATPGATGAAWREPAGRTLALWRQLALGARDLRHGRR
jgi:glycosyltransferase involved in cell wall biosynthesis